MSFQLTASRRGWQCFAQLLIRFWHFNSQPHEEADRKLSSLNCYCNYFNSQPHEEADTKTWTTCFLMEHFNSQPHEEADKLLKRLNTRKNYFNSQPHEEADNSRVCHKSNCYPFQLTASRRGWRLSSIPINFCFHFNSQPHEEADIPEHPNIFLIFYFNSQPHEEADLQTASNISV